jgi:hypothetical protein
MFAALQRDFAEALADPARAVPEDIAACHADGAARRFSIYRNNVAVGLLDALAARFPVTQQIVGEAFFKSIARLYITAHPPMSPLMMFYGDDFPGFIASFEAARDIAYLPDVARLETARTRAYHAEDAAPLDAAVLHAIEAEDLGDLRFSLHPAVEIVSSPYPVVTILAMHMGEIPLAEITDWQGEEALISRPYLDVDIHCLPPGGGAFLRILGDGHPLAEAVEAAVAAHPGFDLAVNLAGLFSAGLVTSLSIIASEEMSP